MVAVVLCDGLVPVFDLRMWSTAQKWWNWELRVMFIFYQKRMLFLFHFIQPLYPCMRPSSNSRNYIKTFNGIWNSFQRSKVADGLTLAELCFTTSKHLDKTLGSTDSCGSPLLWWRLIAHQLRVKPEWCHKLLLEIKGAILVWSFTLSERMTHLIIELCTLCMMLSHIALFSKFMRPLLAGALLATNRVFSCYVLKLFWSEVHSPAHWFSRDPETVLCNQ